MEKGKIIMFIPLESEKDKKKLTLLMKENTGAFAFNVLPQDLFSKPNKNIKLIENIFNQKCFLIQRDNKNNLNFIHQSPGVGARICSASLNGFESCKEIKICFGWSPEKLILYILNPHDKNHYIEGGIAKLDYKIMILPDGSILEVGGKGLEVGDISVINEDKKITENTAIESWSNIINAINILLKATSTEGFIFDVVKYNICVVLLTTGFETYCKKRFYEISKNTKASILNRIYKNILKKKDNVYKFQNYDRCKAIYKEHFNISFSKDLGVRSNTVGGIKECLKFRHKIIHNSPLIAQLNFGEWNKQRKTFSKPIFQSKDFIEKSINDFEEFINKLHKKTLELE